MKMTPEISEGKIAFKFVKRPKDMSKLKPVVVIVYIHDAISKVNKKIEVTSEVHNKTQDLVATLFRRGVRDSEDTKVIYGPGSIVMIIEKESGRDVTL